MKRILRATKDGYITNRIIRDSFRATDANVGLAGTLDLFKLAGESQLTGSSPFVSGTTDPIELSRVLIKFDVSPITALTSSILDMNHPSFRCTLSLKDVMGGQTLPSNFSLVLYPLAQSFDEGIGRDVSAFEDIDAANYLTASVSSGLALWNVSGADAKGYVGQTSIDVITGSMTLGDLFVTQSFTDGSEDLSMDITRIVSATISGQIPDHGFRLSFSGTQETDDRTRFVKRFGTRHSTEPRLRPSIEVGFNDSIIDHHRSFFFDVSGSLFLNNIVRGALSNIVSGSTRTPITGSNSLVITLTTGSAASGTYYRTVVSASQHVIGQNSIAGIYSATFVVSPAATGALLNEVSLAHSATFTEVWGSSDGTVGFYTGTLVMYDASRTTTLGTLNPLRVSATNVRNAYKSSDRPRVRVFIEDDGASFKATKLPIESQSMIFEEMHYRVFDANNDTVVFDFDTVTNSTRLSVDATGPYFDLYASDLDPGRSYCIDVMIVAQGTRQVFRNVSGIFRVDA